ncbi:fibronectin type III domain-containing protein [Modestobacter sp. URMC 112]
MHITSPSRRAAGLVAAAAVGLSTAVLSVPGLAAAAPVLPSMSFSTEDGDVTSGPVPEGICGMTWRVIGGQGGVDGEGAPGQLGGELKLTTVVEAGDVFALSAGGAGTTAAGTASVVTLDGQTYLSAGGGALIGGAPATNVGFDQRVSLYPYYDSSQLGYTLGTTPSDHAGDGLIEGTGVLCTPPPAPYVDGYAEVDDHSATVRLVPIPLVNPDGSRAHGGYGIPFQPAGGYEYSLDGTNWVPLSTGAGAGDDADALFGTIGDLVTGTQYNIKIRSTSLVGPGPVSDTVSARPLKTYPAPTDVEVEVGVKSLTVSWKAPADTTGITGYFVGAYPLSETDPDQQDAKMLDCTTPVDQLRCTLPAEAGEEYAVVVFANAADEEYQGTPSEEVLSGKVPGFVAPATVPAASAPLVTTDADKAVKVGEQVTVSGSGYLPGSEVDIVMYSTPQVLTTVVADADGAFTATVTVPTGLADGTHHLVAAGVDEDGNPRNLVLEVTVSGGVAAVSGPAGAATLGATSGTGSAGAATSAAGAKAAAAGLAYTGFTALPFVGAGLLALLAGGGLVVAGRRRRA